MLKNYMTRSITLVFYFLTIIIVTGCNQKCERIKQITAINLDNKEIAIAIGPCIKKYPYIENIKTCAAIFDMNLPSTVKLIKESEPLSAFAWRPSYTSHTLYISTFPLGKPGNIIEAEYFNGHVKVNTISLPEDIIFMYINWNKTGQILAGSAFKGYNHFLGFYSYEDSKFIITNIPSSKNIVWKDEKSLYLYDEGRISAVSIIDGNCQVIENFSVIGDVFLIGMFDGKLAYRADNKIYLGNKILYEAASKIGAVAIDDNNIAFQTEIKSGREVIVIDGSGNVKNEKNVEEGSILVAFVNGFIYLCEDQKYIKKFNLNDSTKISSIFSVNDIN
jgi:hypothetical protein